MDLTKTLYYGAVVIGVLIAVGVVVSVVSAILSLLRLLLVAALLIGVVYAAYRVRSWLSGDDDGNDGHSVTDRIGNFGSSTASESRSTGSSPGGRDRLRRQYVEGEIDEAEFERRIEREFEAEDLDDIERELERER